MSGFSCGFVIIVAHYAYPNFLNKNINLFRMLVPNYYDYLFGFVDACKDSIMVDDDVMPSNPPVVRVEKEELKEAPLGVNVS
jgi:hypothetical protein